MFIYTWSDIAFVASIGLLAILWLIIQISVFVLELVEKIKERRERSDKFYEKDNS